MGLQIRSDLFAVDNKGLGSKSINIVDNMQRLLAEKKARDTASKFDLLKEVGQKKTDRKRFQVKHDGKMEELKQRRAEKRATAVEEYWRAVIREKKMKVESKRAKQEEEEEEEEENEEERKERKEMRRKEWEEKEREFEEMGKRRREEERNAAKENRELECDIEVIEVSDEDEVMVEEGGGRWFNARTILLEMTAGQGKKAMLNDGEVFKSESPIKMHEPLCADIEASEELMAGGKYSDHLGDAVKVKCKLCNSFESLTAMRSHTKKYHKMTITMYRERFGQLADHMVESVYHKCRMCDKILLLDADLIYHHARTHGLSFKEYTSKYMTLKNKRKS